MHAVLAYPARIWMFIPLMAILSSCASTINSLQAPRNADIQSFKLKEIRVIEKHETFDLLILSENTMRYKIHRNEARNLTTIDIPYLELPSSWEQPEIKHSYIKDFSIVQSPDKPSFLKVIIETIEGIALKSSLTSGGDGLRIVLYPEKRDEYEIKSEGYYLYRVKYADSSGIAQILKRLIPYGDSKIQVNEKDNYLLFDSKFEGSEQLMKLLPEMDKPPYQILFEAEIVEINVDDMKNLGISFRSPITTTFQEIQSNPPSYSTVDIPIQEIVRTPISLVTAINFLKEKGKAKTLSNPRVSTADGVEAKVVTAERIPYFITEVQANYTYITKQEFTAGIELKITPRVNDDGMITTKIRTSVSSITGSTPQGYPRTSSRDIESTLRVMAGQTIIIGGLLEDRSIKTTTGIPWLSDIPVVGRVFRAERVENKQMELFIFITPYLLEDGEV